VRLDEVGGRVLAAPVLPATLGGTPRREGAACDHPPRDEWPVAAEDGLEGGSPASPTGPVNPAGFPEGCTSDRVPPAVSVGVVVSPSSDPTSAIDLVYVMGDVWLLFGVGSGTRRRLRWRTDN